MRAFATTAVCLAVMASVVSHAAGSAAVSTHKKVARPTFRYDNAGVPHRGRLGQVTGGWPACSPGSAQMTGYFNINANTNKNYWYWAFESQGNPLTDPVILWMTGGPGCSSSLAVLAENGPCHINETDGSLYMNPYSWSRSATVIYIDQPAGVGFSYADFPSGYDYNETMVANDMYYFVQAFFTAFPQYLQNDFFVFGESYGGHFAPATAHRIWQGIQKKEGIIVNLKGLGVGNGMTAPAIQFQHYAPLAYQWCKTVKGEPCITKEVYEGILAATPQCVALAEQCNGPNGGNNTACTIAFEFCGNNIMGPFFNTGLNQYDIRIPCAVPGLCYNFTQATNFMNLPAVQAAFGVNNITWGACNYQVNGMFGADWMRTFNQYIPDLLGSNIRVMIYAGDMDYICNWLGNKAWTLQLQWPQKTQFNAQADLPWYVDELEAGLYRTVGNSNINMLFTFLQVHGAGHMVPMDQPKRILVAVQHFLADSPLYGFAL